MRPQSHILTFVRQPADNLTYCGPASVVMAKSRYDPPPPPGHAREAELDAMYQQTHVLDPNWNGAIATVPPDGSSPFGIAKALTDHVPQAHEAVPRDDWFDLTNMMCQDTIANDAAPVVLVFGYRHWVVVSYCDLADPTFPGERRDYLYINDPAPACSDDFEGKQLDFVVTVPEWRKRYLNAAWNRLPVATDYTGKYIAILSTAESEGRATTTAVLQRVDDENPGACRGGVKEQAMGEAATKAAALFASERLFQDEPWSRYPGKVAPLKPHCWNGGNNLCSVPFATVDPAGHPTNQVVLIVYLGCSNGEFRAASGVPLNESGVPLDEALFLADQTYLNATEEEIFADISNNGILVGPNDALYRLLDGSELGELHWERTPVTLSPYLPYYEVRAQSDATGETRTIIVRLDKKAFIKPEPEG